MTGHVLFDFENMFWVLKRKNRLNETVVFEYPQHMVWLKSLLHILTYFSILCDHIRIKVMVCPQRHLYIFTMLVFRIITYPGTTV